MFQPAMKRIALALALVAAIPQPSLCHEDLGFIYPGKSDYPKIKRTGTTTKSFIPKGWTTVDEAKGDLNGDKRDDIAIVIKAEAAKFKQDNSQGIGPNVFDTNPRMLVVLFKDAKKNAYHLAEQNNNFIAIADSPTMMDPFESLSIKKGVLEVNFMLFFNAGGWSASKTCYKFRFQNNQFALIGADKNELQRNTGEETNFSINFLTGRMKVASVVPMEEFKSQTSWSKFRLNKLRTMRSFKTLYDWQPQPGLYL